MKKRRLIDNAPYYDFPSDLNKHYAIKNSFVRGCWLQIAKKEQCIAGVGPGEYAAKWNCDANAVS